MARQGADATTPAMLIGSLLLTGGRSERMGRPKESLRFGDDTLLGHAASVLEATTWPVVIVARDEQQELPPLPVELEIVYDREKDEGPLAAIETGLERLQRRCDWVFVTACDMPFLGSEVVSWLASFTNGCELVVPQVAGELQVMASLWRTTLLPMVRAARAAGAHAPKEIVPRVNARIVTQAEVDSFDASRRFLFSVDTPEAYETALRWAGGG